MEDGPITDITYPDFPRNWEWKTIELYPGETDGREREAWDVAQVTLVKLKDIPEPYRKIVKLEGPSEIEDTWTLTWQQW